MKPSHSIAIFILFSIIYILPAQSQAAAAPAILSAGEIRSAVAPDRCLDVAGANFTNGTNIQSYECNKTPAQKWYLTSNGQLRAGGQPNMCLDVSTGTAYAGANVHLWQCHDGNNQKWSLTEQGQFKSLAGSNMCLAVAASGTHNGANVVVWSCKDIKDQKWTLAKLPYHRISSKLGAHLCMDVGGNNPAQGANVITWFCHNGYNQQWLFTPQGEVRSAVANNRCLDVTGGNFASGANLQTWECNGTPAQKFTVTDKGELRSTAHPEYCVDVSGASQAPGANVQLYHCNNTAAQQWVSAGFMSIELQNIDGTIGLIYRQNTQAYVLTQPVAMLKLLKQYGANLGDIATLFNSFSQAQKAIVIDYFGSDQTQYFDLDIQQDGTVPVSKVTLDGPESDLHCREHDEQNGIDCRSGFDLLDFTAEDVLNGNVNALDTVAILHFDHTGGIELNTGSTLIGVSGRLGDEDGSHIGASAGAGIGLEGAAKWGENDQYGVTFGIKAVTVNIYVKGEDVRTAYKAVVDWGKQAINDTAYFFENDFVSFFEVDVKDFFAQDVADFFAGDVAGFFADVGTGIGQGATEVANALEDAWNWFTGLF